jgi:hypothetical protein
MSLKVGQGAVPNDAPAHTPGVRSGNAKGNYEAQKGFLPDGRRTMESVTGIDPGSRGPIDPSMPCLPPA